MSAFSKLNLKVTFLWLFMFLVGGGVLASGKDVAASPAQAEQSGKTVTVQVIDDVGPIAGAAVVVKDTKNGNTTNLEGVVVLNGVSNNSILVISLVGYITQEINIGTKDKLTVTLVEDKIALKEAVAIGYGSLDKKLVTSSISSVRGDDLMQGVGGADITTALQGKIPGLVMHSTGNTYSSSSIQLRGLTSINAGTSPLIVIDGFPGADIRTLSVDDIKSIDVLKDASAGAIYGTRAASGVILITTKSGSDTGGKVHMTYSNELSYKQGYNAPDLMSAEEYLEYGLGPDYGGDTDWYQAMINKKNFSQRHNLALDYGTENVGIHATFYYDDKQGLVIGDRSQAFGGSINANFKLFKGWVEINPYVEIRRTKYDERFQGDVGVSHAFLFNNPTRPIYDSESETGYNIWTGTNYEKNFVADINMTNDKRVYTWIKPMVNLKLNILPVEGLSYQQTFGWQHRQETRSQYLPSTYSDLLTTNTAGQAYLYYGENDTLNSEGYFSYDRTFKGKHAFNAVLGYSYYQYDDQSFSMTNSNFTIDGTTVWNISEGSDLTDGKASMSSSKGITQRLFSTYLRANYAYDDRYLVSGTLRYEGSSKFAVNNRWALFWAASVGWRISGEKFMKNAKWVDDLKIRAGYGVTGNNDFSASYTANRLIANVASMSDQYGVPMVELPDGSWAYSYGKEGNVNDDLGWEKKSEWDFGLDFSFFNGRLYGKFDYFYRKISGIIYYVDVPSPPYVQTSMYENIGKMNSKGWEIELGGDIIRSKSGFTWSSNLNLEHHTGKILTLYGDNSYIEGSSFPNPGNPGNVHRIEAGTKVGSYCLWKFAGFDEDGKFLLYNQYGEVIPGEEKGYTDKQDVGNYIPKLIMSWSHTFTYKNFDLGINLRSWIGFDVYNAMEMYCGIQKVDTAGGQNVLRHSFTKNANIDDNFHLTDYFLEDGSFLKIDAITLGYTLPLSKQTNGMINRFRFYITCGNLATWTGYSGLDPEVDITGWDGGVDKFWSGFYPTTRTWTLGMQFKF